MIINVSWSPYMSKVSVMLVRFYWEIQFLGTSQYDTEMSNFMKIPLVGAELFIAMDRETNMMKLTVAYRSFFYKRL